MFQFKQFTVHQERNAMKVCTDSCIFGALVEVENAQRILDIGTGTGLLALMAAQRSEAKIEAVELNSENAQEAEYNVSLSPWSTRIRVIESRIQDFHSEEKFDCILSNPPFYKNSFRSENQQRNAVMQQDALQLKELAECIARLLSSDGNCWILLPENEMKDFIECARLHNLFVNKKIQIRNKSDQAPIRWVCQFSFKECEKVESDFTIYSQHHQYSSQFIQLLKAYYLKL